MELSNGLLITTAGQVARSFSANWPFLVTSIVVATAMNSFVDQRAVAGFMRRHRRGGVVAATAAAVGTPLCSCGTTAVVLGMMASVVPWAPVVAFMVASPLTSPQELVYSAGLFGWRFALAFFVASIALGLAGGAIAQFLDSAGLLEGQNRLTAAPGAPEDKPARRRFDARAFGGTLGSTAWKLGLFFFAFSALGYLLNNLMPSRWVAVLFGSGRTYAVPLAATLGIPFYFNTEASLPLLRPMIDAGMSHGAALAFLITGGGTSIGAIAGAFAIARWRVVAIVIGTLWIGAIVFGFVYDAMGGLL